MELALAFLILLAVLSIVVALAFYDVQHGVTDNSALIAKKDDKERANRKELSICSYLGY
jgi:cell division protein FtsL